MKEGQDKTREKDVWGVEEEQATGVLVQVRRNRYKG